MLAIRSDGSGIGPEQWLGASAQLPRSHSPLYNDGEASATYPRPLTLTPAMQITLNGEVRHYPRPLSVAELLEQLGHDRRRVAVEVNREVVPAARHAEHRLSGGDAVEIVTLVGGGAPAPEVPADKPLVIGKFTFRSRLITGTGKYADYELMHDCLAASGCEVTTV